MTLQEAISKYGPIENNTWEKESLFCSVLKIPPDISTQWVNSLTGQPTRNIYCNRDIQDPLLRALQNIRDRGLLRELKTFDGCFMVRNIRGSTDKVSTHAYALAVDLNAKTNALGSRGDISKALVECFTSEGWKWGGDFQRCDPMHFQYLAEW